MKILFFTPCLKTSAIGRVSSLVVGELVRQGHDVAVVRAEDTTLFSQPIHPIAVDVLTWDSQKAIRAKAKDADIVVYQIGNHYSFHRGCIEWLQEIPGVISLHDNFLGHLFWSCAEVMGRARAKELLTQFYGEKVAMRFFDHPDSLSFINFASEAAPMTEWVAAMATGVIVHSSWALDRIASACPGPVEVVPLPYDAPYSEDVFQDDNLRHEGNDVVILTIGHVNTNKRHASVIEAIGSSALLRERMLFRIVGAIEPAMAEGLRAKAEHLGVRVTITGEVDSQQLAAEIHGADAMCCLRWPALEAASASTIEAMLYGKPAIVTDTGFYRDLPDDCVLKISPHDEIASLRTALELLAQAPEERVAMGALARRYAASTFRADRYAERIAAMKSRIDQSRIIADAGQIFSGALARWGGRGAPELIEPIAKPLVIFR